jgi:hypothetical protein
MARATDNSPTCARNPPESGPDYLRSTHLHERIIDTPPPGETEEQKCLP